MKFEQVQTLANICEYFDKLIVYDDDDLLFASSYIRGFLVVAAVPFGDEQQRLSQSLYTVVSKELAAAKTELSPQDKAIVDNFWQQIKPAFI